MKQLKDELLSRELTCLVVWESGRFESQQRGVKPLLQLLDNQTLCPNGKAADKVVGRATAFLYCLLQVKSIHALVLSQGALEVLEAFGIVVTYDTLVPSIRNRDNSGPCPMEAATAACQSPESALAAIRATLDKLAQS